MKQFERVGELFIFSLFSSQMTYQHKQCKGFIPLSGEGLRGGWNVILTTEHGNSITAAKFIVYLSTSYDTIFSVAVAYHF